MEKNLTLSEKFEKLKKLQKTLDSEYEKAITKFREKRNEINQGYIEIFNFEKKFIKIKDIIDEHYTYMYCDYIWKSSDLNNDPILTFRGYGFYWEVSPYEDFTFSRWADWLDIEIRLVNNDLQKELKRFEVITPDEFNEAYNQMIKEMNKHHQDNIEYYIKQNKDKDE